MKSKFFPNKTALVTLVAACFVVNVSMGVRQTFGLFSGDFEIDCGISNTEFGLAIALHALIWGIVTPIFGRFADKHGGSKMVIFTLIIYGVGVLALGNNFNTGTWFQINLGLMVGILVVELVILGKLDQQLFMDIPLAKEIQVALVKVFIVIMLLILVGDQIIQLY